MRQVAVDFFTKGRVALEGELVSPEGYGERLPAFVICHSHPMTGGDMNHQLVMAVVRTASRDGLASLRFNFRGVGLSKGTFDNGSKEQHDVKSGLEFLRMIPGVDRGRLGIVGHSFGADVILEGLKRYKFVRSFVLISPSVRSITKSKIRQDDRPKLFLIGQRDNSEDLRRSLRDVKDPLQFVELPGADHSFRDMESEVAGHVSEFLSKTLS